MRTYSYLAVTTLWLTPILLRRSPTAMRLGARGCSATAAAVIQKLFKTTLAPILSASLVALPGRARAFVTPRRSLPRAWFGMSLTLDAFLAAPTQAIPGTSMPIALAREEDRADVLACLRTLIQS